MNPARSAGTPLVLSKANTLEVQQSVACKFFAFDLNLVANDFYFFFNKFFFQNAKQKQANCNRLQYIDYVLMFFRSTNFS